MDTLHYAPGSGGPAICLDCREVASAAAPKLRSYALEYDLGSFGVSSAVASARKVSLDVVARRAVADELVTALARDAESVRPGTLTLLGWSQRCLVPEVDVSKVYIGHVTLDLTMVLLDGFWWRERSRYFPRGTSSGGIDPPLDPPHDYGHESGRAVVTNDSAMVAPLMLRYWGPCVNPYVLVGENRHQVNVELTTGSVLTIDAREARKSVTLANAQGVESNAFSGAVREDGAQAFAPLPVGDTEVTWSGAFAFELTWRERRVVPPWVP